MSESLRIVRIWYGQTLQVSGIKHTVGGRPDILVDCPVPQYIPLVSPKPWLNLPNAIQASISNVSEVIAKEVVQWIILQHT